MPCKRPRLRYDDYPSLTGVVMMRRLSLLLAAVSAGTLSAGVGRMKTPPDWSMAEPFVFGTSSPVVLDQAAWTNFSFDAFVAMAEYSLGETPVPDGSAVIFDQRTGTTGWALSLRADKSGNRVSVVLVLNGQYDFVHSFDFVPRLSGEVSVTARGGLFVVCVNGKPVKRLVEAVVPNLAGLTVGRNSRSGGSVWNGVTMRSAAVWGRQEEFFAAGEDQSSVSCVKRGPGWSLSLPAKFVDGLPNVLFYGDSICCGYLPLVAGNKWLPAGLLTGKANVYHWIGFVSNPKTQDDAAFEAVAHESHADVIFFNNGLHSISWTEESHSDDVIRDSYRRMVRAFRKGAPNARIYYLLTTPHTSRGPKPSLGPRNGTVMRLNRLAAEVMSKEGVPVVDIYSRLVDRLELAAGDSLHWQPAGYKVIAEEVARSFLSGGGNRR